MQTKYVKQPLHLPSELTRPLVPPEPTKGVPVVEYAIKLLGIIEQANIDRTAVRASVDQHNSTGKK